MTQTFNNEQLDLICRSLAITSTGISEHFTADECTELADLLKEIEIRYMRPRNDLELSRYEYNVKIVNLLTNSQEFRDLVKKYRTPEFDEFIDTLGNTIYQHKNQRFAQIWCNYIVPDYREPKPGEFAKWSLGFLFGNIHQDPFYIESKTTYKYLKNKL